jgi:DNA-binding PadR family transcriptional regulator
MEFNKDLIAASSTPIVLAILSEGDSYGYAIIKRVQELSSGHMEWTDGMLYPVLHRLERLGYIKARWEEAESGRRRKYYRITSQGKTQLAEERKQWQAVDATLRGIWKRDESETPGTRYKMSNIRSQDCPVLNFSFLKICLIFRIWNFVLDVSTCYPVGRVTA